MKRLSAWILTKVFRRAANRSLSRNTRREPGRVKLGAGGVELERRETTGNAAGGLVVAALGYGLADPLTAMAAVVGDLTLIGAAPREAFAPFSVSDTPGAGAGLGLEAWGGLSLSAPAGEDPDGAGEDRRAAQEPPATDDPASDVLDDFWGRFGVAAAVPGTGPADLGGMVPPGGAGGGGSDAGSFSSGSTPSSIGGGGFGPQEPAPSAIQPVRFVGPGGAGAPSAARAAGPTGQDSPAPAPAGALGEVGPEVGPLPLLDDGDSAGLLLSPDEGGGSGAGLSSVPSVWAVAEDPTASETGESTGAFRLARDGDLSSALTVTYTVSGTATPYDDYEALSGTATFQAGEASALVLVSPADDPEVEATETVVLTLEEGPDYAVAEPGEAVVTIDSDDLTTVTVAATDPAASEPGTDTGTFTFIRSGVTDSDLQGLRMVFL